MDFRIQNIEFRREIVGGGRLKGWKIKKRSGFNFQRSTLKSGRRARANFDQFPLPASSILT